MKLNLSLKSKMQLFLISLSVAIYAIAIGYISVNSKKSAYKDSVDLVNSSAEKFAFKIQSELNESHAIVRTLAEAFAVHKDMSREQWEPIFLKMYDKVYRDNLHIFKLWDSWELNRIDSTWTKPYGRIINNFSRQNNTVIHNQYKRNLDGDNGLYEIIKTQSKEMILPIYFDEMVAANEEKKLMSSLLTPMIIDNKYHGIVGIDIILEGFQKMVTNIKIEQFPGTFAFLLSHEGKYAGHPVNELLNKEAQFTLKSGNKYSLLKSMEGGGTFSILAIDENKKSHFVAFAPISIGRTNTLWYLGISVPINSIMAQADRNFMISLIVGIVGIFLLSFAIYIITKNISDPIQRITEFLKRMALGETRSKLDLNINTGDEIEEMTKALKTSVEGLNLKTEFANNIGKGNLEYEFKILSEEDLLGEALVNMRNSLKKAKAEEEKRKIEDEKRRWTNEGLAKFAEILRQNNDNISALGDEIIKNLIYYLEANQGGVFILENDENDEFYLNLLSAFAYDTKKFHEKKIKYGDGIVGTCAIEKDTIYMKEIPDDYIEIKSGLGGANPNNLLVVPLKMEETIFGVVEIASFKILENYQIEFVEKVAQSIATTFSSVQVNIKTNELLEKFQQQSEEMSAQEEEMRQNMEELQATQEEAARKNSDMGNFIQALENSSCIAEYNLEGFITKVNDNYLDAINLRRSEVLGIHHSDKVEFSEKQKAEYDKFWNSLKQGISKKEKTKLVIDGKDITFIEMYIPIVGDNGDVQKILKIANKTNDFEE